LPPDPIACLLLEELLWFSSRRLLLKEKEEDEDEEEDEEEEEVEEEEDEEDLSLFESFLSLMDETLPPPLPSDPIACFFLEDELWLSS
jgi:hypothetical protein